MWRLGRDTVTSARTMLRMRQDAVLRHVAVMLGGDFCVVRESAQACGSAVRWGRRLLGLAADDQHLESQLCV